MTLHIAEQRKRIHEASPKLWHKDLLVVGVVAYSGHDHDIWTSPSLVCLKILSTFFYQNSLQYTH